MQLQAGWGDTQSIPVHPSSSQDCILPHGAGLSVGLSSGLFGSCPGADNRDKDLEGVSRGPFPDLIPWILFPI